MPGLSSVPSRHARCVGVRDFRRAGRDLGKARQTTEARRKLAETKAEIVWGSEVGIVLCADENDAVAQGDGYGMFYIVCFLMAMQMRNAEG